MKKEFTTAAEELITGRHSGTGHTRAGGCRCRRSEQGTAGHNTQHGTRADQSKADHGRAAAERLLYALCRSKDRKSKLPVFKKPCKEAHSRGKEPQNVKEWAYQCHS